MSRIHIVCSDTTSDQILARLASLLAEGNGWTLGPEPDENAEVNVFFPYLEWRKTHWHQTLTAAWFTHKEDTVPAKAAIWDATAPEVDLRVTSAAMYEEMLAPYGPTEWAPLPVDCDKFRIADSPRNTFPTIGVSGMVYPGGRKGEHLVSRLAQEHSGWRIKGAGQGWPVETERYLWPHMQKFYQGLDVFLCTSEIEGGPVTVLEAMACGVPVVMPWHVGHLDELGDCDGIYRYEAGDYEEMCEQIAYALVAPCDPDQLREDVADRTADEWCEGWAWAVATLTKPTPKGIITVAYGEPAKGCARELIRTLRKQTDAPIAVVSDEEIDEADLTIVREQGDAGARDHKTGLYDLAPAHWGQVLYLDADILAIGPVDLFFQLLDDGWEMVFTNSPPNRETLAESRRSDRMEEWTATTELLHTTRLEQIAGGVMAWRRCPEAAAFWTGWHEEWAQYGGKDQLALARSLYAHPVRAYLLGTEWNLFAHQDDPERAAALLHFATAARAWGDATHPGRELWEEWRQRV